ncbi:MAG: outer membrane beta-barrel protein [Prevotella sp.]|nr:outer membrane beta-barrel protein [Prevotella sp.]
MKKIALFALALLLSVTASAQFEKGKVYANASVSGFDFSSQSEAFHFGLGGQVGYFLADDLMATAHVGYNHLDDVSDVYGFGVGGRYYIVQNGLYLGADLKFRHSKAYDDFVPGVQVGYAFFISRTVTIEPQLYFDISTKKFDYSSYGLSIGFGVYLFKDHTQN